MSTTYTNATSNQIQRGVQYIPENGAPTTESISPTGALEFIGNDGGGNSAVAVFADSTSVTWSQVGNQYIASASAGGTSAATTGVSLRGTNFEAGNDESIPITQTVATVDAAPTFSSTYGLFCGPQNVEFLSATSNKNFTFSIGIEANVSLTSIPVQMFLYFYIAQGFSIPNGTAPFYMTPVTISSPSQGVSVFQYIADNIPIGAFAPNATTNYVIACAPFFYVPAGQTITGTGVSGTSLGKGAAYFSEQFSYSDNLAPVTTYPLLRSYLAPSNIISEPIYFSTNPYVNTIEDVFSSVFAENSVIDQFPIAQQCVVNGNIAFIISGYNASTTIINVGLVITVAGRNFYTATQPFVVTNQSTLVGSINVLTLPRLVYGNEYVVSGIYYNTNNDVETSTAQIITNGYLSYKTYLATGNYTSTDGMLNHTIENRIVPADVSLSPTPKALNLFPPSNLNPNNPYPNSVANIVDVITIDLPNIPCDVDITFNLSYQTDATTSLTTSATPIIYLVLAQSSSSTSPQNVLNLLNGEYKQLLRGDTSIINDHMTVSARVSYTSSPIYITASAFICWSGEGSDVSATTFTAFGAGSTVAPLTWSSWAIDIQYAPQLSGGGGGGGTTNITGNYPIEVSNDVVSVSPATSSQDGALLTTAPVTENSLAQITATGTVGATITSNDGSIDVTTSEGNINLEVVSTPATATLGVYSPTQLKDQVTVSSVPITAIYSGSSTPPLSAMTPVLSVQITPEFDGDGIYGSQILYNSQYEVYTETLNEDLFVQLCIYSDQDGNVTPILPERIISKDAITSTGVFPTGISLFSGLTSSTIDQPITYTIGCSTKSGLTCFFAVSSIIIAQENLPYTPSIAITANGVAPLSAPITSTTLDLYSIGANVTGSVQDYIDVPKIYNGDYLLVRGVAKVKATIQNSAIGCAFYLAEFSNNGTFEVAYRAFGNSGINVPASGYAECDVPINCVITNAFSYAGDPVGTTTLGVILQSWDTPCEIDLSGISVTSQEVLPLAAGGLVYLSDPYFFSASSTPYVTTATPTYSQTTPMGSVSTSIRFSSKDAIMQIVFSKVPVVGTQNISCTVFLGIFAGSSPQPTDQPVFYVPLCVSPNTTLNAGSVTVYYYIPNVSAGSAVDYTLAVYSGTPTATNIATEATIYFTEYSNLSSTSSLITSVSGDAASYVDVATSNSIATVSNVLATDAQAGLLSSSVPLTANALAQYTASGTTGCSLYSADNTVQVTPAEGSISISSPLRISANGSTLAPILENNLVVSSIAPTIEWQADYIIGGNSSGVLTNVYDSAGSFTQNYSPSSSRLALGEWTRKTASATSPPSANNVATPQWVCCLQPLPTTALKARAIEILVSAYLLGATDIQALAYGVGSLMSYRISVNMTAVGTPSFVKGSPFPFEANYGGSNGVPTAPDDPPYIYFDVIPAASSPSAQFTTGNVLVMYAQWILSTTAGVTPSFDISLKALF